MLYRIEIKYICKLWKRTVIRIQISTEIKEEYIRDRSTPTEGKNPLLVPHFLEKTKHDSCKKKRIMKSNRNVKSNKERI
jgi:hypothetical protein